MPEVHAGAELCCGGRGCRPPAQLAEQWDGADVVVTSYDLLRRDETLYESQKFYACILDEAQAIKNHTTQKYKAVCGVNSRVRFALTGTPWRTAWASCGASSPS